MLTKLNPVYANIAVALIISVLAFRLGGLASTLNTAYPQPHSSPIAPAELTTGQ